MEKDSDVTICLHDVDINFFDVAVIFLSVLVTGPNFVSISWLVQELWQFLGIKDWPEIWKSEILASEFCPIFEDWGKLGIPNLAGVPLIKCYWMLQKASVTGFTVSEWQYQNGTS